LYTGRPMLTLGLFWHVRMEFPAAQAIAIV